jgi:hypothetical protein
MAGKLITKSQSQKAAAMNSTIFNRCIGKQTEKKTTRIRGRVEVTANSLPRVICNYRA